MEVDVGVIVATACRALVSFLTVAVLLPVIVVGPALLQTSANDAILCEKLEFARSPAQKEQGCAKSVYTSLFEHRHWVNAIGDEDELTEEAHAWIVDSNPKQIMLTHCSLAIERAVVSTASTLTSHFWSLGNEYKDWMSKSAATASSWDLILELSINTQKSDI